jgi:hypothetical protein
VRLHEGGQLLLQERAALAQHRRHFGTGVHRRSRPRRDSREDLGPELRLVVVHHHYLHEAGAQHLQEVLVLELFRRGTQPHGRLAFLGEARVELFQMLPVTRRPADEDLLAGQSSTVLTFGEDGPVTAISEIPLQNGAENATC